MSAAEKLYNFLVDHVDIEDNNSYSSWPVGRQLLYVNAQLGTALYKAYEVLATPETDDDAFVTEALQKFYDRYFVPIDLPLNNFTEGLLERYGRGMIPDAVSQLASLVQARNEG